MLYFCVRNYKYTTTNILSFLYFIFLFFVSISFLINPGIPENKYYINEYKTNESIEYTRCKSCNIIVPKELKIGHCLECGICIIKYDHHCKWTGKCIGKGNILFFYFFCLSLFAYIITFFFGLYKFLSLKIRQN